MIEFQALLPAVRLVAGLTFRAQCAFMEIIFFMAARALGFSIAEFCAGFVAALTRQRRMFALQRKAGELMTKSVDRNSDNVGIAAEVIGMAGITRFDAG